MKKEEINNLNNQILIISILLITFFGNLLAFNLSTLVESVKLLFFLISLFIIYNNRYIYGNGGPNLIWIFIALGFWGFQPFRSLNFFVYLIALSFLILKQTRNVNFQPDNLKFSLKFSFLLCLFSLSSSPYVGFNLLQHITFLGGGHHDTLFHAAIASMIKQYGVPSTGLDGLIPIHYHVFSHSVYAGLSKLAFVPVIQIYALATKMIFVPMLFHSMVYFLIQRFEIESFVKLKYVYVRLFIFVILFSGFEFFGVSIESTFISESFLISLIILFYGGGLLQKTQVGNLYWFFIVLSMSSVLTVSKVSVGFIFTIGVSSFYLLNGGFSKMLQKLIFVTLMMGIFYSSMKMFFLLPADSQKPIEFSFFDYHENYTQINNFIQNINFFKIEFYNIMKLIEFTIFIAFYFLGFWLLLLKSDWRRSLLKRNDLFKTVLVVSVVISIFVFALLKIPGGSAGYFGMVSVVLSVVFMSNNFQFKISKGLIFITLILWVSKFSLNLMSTTNRFFLNDNQKCKSLISEINKLKHLNKYTDFNRKTICDPGELHIDTSIIAECLWEREYSKYFIFPAISERKFTGVLPGNRDNLLWYGFEDYKKIKR